MGRRRLPSLSSLVAGLGACVVAACAALWVASWCGNGQAWACSPNGVRSVYVGSHKGAIRINMLDDLGKFYVRGASDREEMAGLISAEVLHGPAGWGFREQNGRWSLRMEDFFYLGRGAISFAPPHRSRIRSIHLVFRAVTVRYWFMLVVAISLASPAWMIALRRRVRRRRHRMGLCSGCGYDLRGSPERCPECGRPVLAKGEP